MKIKSILAFLAIVSLMFAQSAQSQTLTSEKDIVYKVLIPKQESTYFDNTVKETLENKLKKMVASYGFGTENAKAPFTLTPKVILNGFETVPGATPKVIATLEITLYIDDASTKKNYTSTTLKCKGIGDSERNAFLLAVKNMKDKSPVLEKLVFDAKDAICAAYNLQCTKQVAEQQVVAENQPVEKEKKKEITKPDVDLEIPITTVEKSNVFVLAIGNEDYTSFQTGLNAEVNVDYAKNDATIFKEYMTKTIGVPERNITLVLNGTLGQMKQAITKLCKLAEVSKGEAELIFYYSGHGLPDEKTKEGYLMPVDVSGTEIASAIKVTDLYKQLIQSPVKRVSVFLDACFSGGGRNQGLVAMKGVKIKAKEEQLNGNLLVFSSSSGEESSAVFRDKMHGLFTYYLLKKLQETSGNLTYKDLTDYVTEKVKLESVLINNKNQTPQVIGSPTISEVWQQWKVK